MPAESYIQWCNENEGRAYPLAEHASQVDLYGHQLPTDILADMCIMVPPEYADAYVSFVRCTDALFAVSIASSQGPLLHCAAPRAGYVPYAAVPLVPLADDVSGWVAFGNHIPAPAPGRYKFAGPEAALSSRVVRIVDRVPVRQFALLDGDPAIWLDKLTKVLGGTALRVYAKPDEPGTIVIELDKDRAATFVGPCSAPSGVPPICTIAGVSADQDGVLTLRFRGAP